MSSRKAKTKPGAAEPPPPEPPPAPPAAAAAAAAAPPPAKRFSVLDMPDVPKGLPATVELARKYVICGPDFNSHTEDYMNAHSFMACGVDNTFTLDDFKRGFSIEVTSLDASSMTFEMKGVGPAVANAFRRILLSEVPTVAIEHVFVVNNTSVLQDEVLAHRLGLVPLGVDPRLLDFRAEGDAAGERNTVVLRLKLACRRGADGAPTHGRVTAADLEWLPEGSALPEESDVKLTSFSCSQEALLPGGVAAVQPDILLAKLRPGQEIELEAHAVKGTGRVHAKWSPVGTAWYELCPEVVFLSPGAAFAGADAVDFLAAVHPAGWDAHAPPGAPRAPQACFALAGAGDAARLTVANPRACWYCLERVRRLGGDPRWAGRVQLRRVKEHYLYTVESVGQLPPEVLFSEAVAILREKCARLLAQL